jgi:cell division protein FtsB
MDDLPRTPAPSRGRRVGRTLGLVGGGAGLVLALGLGVFPTRSFLDQRAQVSEAEQRLAVLREQNAALADQLDELSTPEEIERLAREEYNLVRPGEEAYSVLPAPLPALELPQVWPFGPLSGPPDAQ